MNITGSPGYKHFFADKHLQVAYLNVPKCACTTIKVMVCDLEGVSIPRAEDYLPFRQTPADVVKAGSFRFTFVREPIGRFLSFYKDKILRWDRNIGPALERNGFRKDMGLDDVITIIEATAPAMLEPHIRPMTQIVFDEHGNSQVDYVGKLESFPNDIAPIARLLGKAPLANKSQTLNRSDPALKLTLNEQQRIRLRRIYEADLEAFKY